jgi:hypothetical protein
MKINGGCHCGNITYEATADPEKSLICHCTDCQIMSGSAYRTIIFVPSNQFSLLTGELKTYLKTADSGNSRAMAFCENCGSHIYACDATDNPETLGVRLGTCNQRDQIQPSQQYYCKSKLPWTDNLEEIPILS